MKKDKYNLQLIRKLIKPGFTVLDIGANIGYYSRFLADLAGSTGRVYCFEPDVTNYSHLLHELKNRSNVVTFQKAIAAESGTLTLYTSGLLNVDHRTYKPDQYTGTYVVAKNSIDDFVNNQFKIDFIKMDIQGFETEALLGMKQTIAANPGLVIFTELWPYGLKSAGSSGLEMYELIISLGFIIFKISKGNVSILGMDDVIKMKVDYFTDIDVLLSRQNIFY